MKDDNEEEKKDILPEHFKVSKMGRPHKYATVEELAEKCEEYFKWCMENPLQSEEIVKMKDFYKKDTTSKLRAFTIIGLCTFLNISEDTFKNYEKRTTEESKEEGHEHFLGVCTRVRNIIWSQKFEGAAAGMLNPSIIAREMGLKDHSVNEIKGGIEIDFSE